jgi:hypothetical protein
MAALFQGGPVAPNEAVLLVDVATAGLLDVPVLENIGFLNGDVSAEFAGDIRVFWGMPAGGQNGWRPSWKPAVDRGAGPPGGRVAAEPGASGGRYSSGRADLTRRSLASRSIRA